MLKIKKTKLYLSLCLFLSSLQVYSYELGSDYISGIDSLKIMKADKLSQSNLSHKKICLIDDGYDVSHNAIPHPRYESRITGVWLENTNTSHSSFFNASQGSGQFKYHRANWWKKNYEERVSDGYMQEYVDHGTDMASVMFGKKDGKQQGVLTGDTQQVHIVITNHGPNGFIEALNECKNQQADVISFSVGFTKHRNNYPLLKETISKFYREHNILIFAAAHNDNEVGHKTNSDYPAIMDDVISIGAVNKSGKAEFGTLNSPKVDLLSPGKMIKTACATSCLKNSEGIFLDSSDELFSTAYRTFQNGDSWYRTTTGTSPATAIAAGIATLVWNNHPNCSAKQLKEALFSTSQELRQSGMGIRHGLIDAAAASEKLSRICGSSSDSSNPYPEQTDDNPWPEHSQDVDDNDTELSDGDEVISKPTLNLTQNRSIDKVIANPEESTTTILGKHQQIIYINMNQMNLSLKVIEGQATITPLRNGKVFKVKSSIGSRIKLGVLDRHQSNEMVHTINVFYSPTKVIKEAINAQLEVNDHHTTVHTSGKNGVKLRLANDEFRIKALEENNDHLVKINKYDPKKVLLLAKGKKVRRFKVIYRDHPEVVMQYLTVHFKHLP